MVAMAALTHSQAFAQIGGINLSWDDCGLAGSLNKDFACGSNAGTSVLVPSVYVVEMSPTVVRSNIVFFFDGLVPSWWALQSGGCRNGAVSIAPSAGGLAGCVDYFGTHQGASVFNWTVLTSGGTPIGYRLDLLTYTASQNATYLGDLTEIYGGVITFDHRLTAGPDSCGGCSIRGGFTFLSARIEAIEFPGGLTADLPANREYVLWQQPTVPTRRTTWGGVKALYR